MRTTTIAWLMMIGLMLTPPLYGQTPLYRSDAFVVTDSTAVQGDLRAVALSPTRIASNYERPRTMVNFKFSINAQDNERAPGEDHAFDLPPTGTRIVTPVYTFGVLDEPTEPRPGRAEPLESDRVEVVFRLDMRHVLDSFATRGAYDPPNGPPIAADDFEGVYVVGNVAPLDWDFGALGPDSPRRLTDPDGDGIYETTLTFDRSFSRPLDDEGRAVWSLQEDVSGFPQFASPQRLVDALYNLSLEELRRDVRDDGAFMAGAKWPGVWTRDVSYSIVLALALVDPEGARRSLMAKVQDGRIIQDTGTGGSWPVSSDRMTWALAAWEVYAVTGDEDWLRTAHDLIRASAEADLRTVFDPTTGLFYGESSFLDWREQTYPRWMDPKDIYLSQNLGTNAVHYATYRILARMAEALGEPSAAYDAVADTVRGAMNAYLWMADRGYYGQYRYGRNNAALSPRAEALGEALAIIYGVADAVQQRRITAEMPLVPFGVPSIYPQSTGISPYHNNGIWPFVVAYWTWAAAEAGNAAAVEHGLASIYRAAAFFLTNKENMVATTGHFAGTEVNSDRQLWSVAGTLSTVYRVLFGMRFEPDRLVFAPFVPEAYGGTRTLTDLRYRDAVLTVTVEGHGRQVARVTLDGKEVPEAVVPGDLTGAHTLVITLADAPAAGTINLVENRFAPATPHAVLEGATLVWEAVEDAVAYHVFRDGEPMTVTTVTQVAVEEGAGLAAYQVRAVDGRGLASFLSEPVRVSAPEAEQVVQVADGTLATEHAGYTGPGYLPLTRQAHTTVEIPVEVDAAGRYSIDVRYANGSGPINTDNKAAIRTLLVDGRRVGAVVMPQRGTDLWTDWGYSNPLAVDLAAGRHTLTLTLTASDANMNQEVNKALLDHVRLTRLGGR